MRAYVEELLARQRQVAEERSARALLTRLLRGGGEIVPAAPAAEPAEATPGAPGTAVFEGQAPGEGQEAGQSEGRIVVELAAQMAREITLPGEEASVRLPETVAGAEPVRSAAAEIPALAGAMSEEDMTAALAQRLSTSMETAGPVAMSEGAALGWMANRLRRALAAPMPPAGQDLPTAGPREMTQGADAAALSRLYERDARRYDGTFELPL